MINEINKANINKSFRVLLLALAFTAIGLVVNPSGVSAAPPPASCFDFNSGTNTIEDYYDNEGKNGANPACPRDVDIPATIGGDAVTILGDSSFDDKNITAVTIPTSVIDIQNRAFANNKIESIVIPNSVSFLNGGVFFNNHLTTIIIPNSIVSIDSAAFATNHITRVLLPDSVVSLHITAFVGQSALGNNVYSDVFTSGDAVLAQAGMD